MSFAKQHLEKEANETEILGILLDKESDSFIIQTHNFSKRLTKRSMLQTFASVYDTLGFISHYLVTGKVIYRNVCDLKLPWNEEILRENQNQWLKRTRDLHAKIELPGLIPIKRKQIS